MRKILSALLVCIMVLSSAAMVGVAKDRPELVIIYTNDTHCQVDGDLGFEDISAIEAEETAKGNEVIIVDAGDAVQGGAIGAISKGSYIIDIMNAVGYDCAGLGNHEFDYGIPRQQELADMADFPYVSANFMSLEKNDTLYAPYYMTSAEGMDIAFIGIITPNTFTSSAPEYFKNDAGEFIYDFNGGDDFYNDIQATIDNAEAEGADVIIALTHLGVDPADAPYTSQELIKNTGGLDAVIDAHSHTVIEGEVHKDKTGDEVILTSTGSKFENIGVMRVYSADEIVTDLYDKDYKTELADSAAYDKTKAVIDEIKAEYTAELERVVAASEVDLTVNDPSKYSEETGPYRQVRRGETNMADFCADAYKAVLGCDVAFINGGGVRADIAKGEVTYGDILNVNPFGNELCVIEATGLQIADALEHGARSYPNEEGAFLHPAGLTYEIDENTSSTVVLDENGMFKQVTGDRRVKNIRVNGEAIDLDKKYTVGGSAYSFLDGGDGFSMFEGAAVINDFVCTDCDALIDYATNTLGGTIGKGYENPLGDGRIKLYDAKKAFADIEGHWAQDSIEAAVENGIVNGINETEFAPDEGLTRGMFVTMLYRMDGAAEVSADEKFADIADDAYYKIPAMWAKAKGIMQGTGDNMFEPEALITREEMAVAIINYFTYSGNELLLLSSSPTVPYPDYADEAQISDWALEAINLCRGMVMQGDESNSFNPQDNATRAEAVVTVLRAVQLISIEE